MIQAYLNNEEIRMFPDIAIGVTIENFNISDISNRKIDRTNVIRVPKAGNEDIFEFSSLPNAPTDYAYQDYDFDLIVDGIKIYENGRAFIAGEDESSYTLQITNSKNVIDLLKSISLATLYEGDAILFTNTTNWLNVFKQETAGFKIDFLYHEDDPDPDAYWWHVRWNYISIYVSTILAKIAADYDVSFSGNILTNADYIKMRIPCVSVNITRDRLATNMYIQDLIIHDSLNAWDLLKIIMQLTCSVFKINGTDVELQKFNDLDITTPVDWSGKMVSKSKKFSIPNTAQKNYIRHTVASNIDKNQDGGLIECNNLNLPYEKDLATMKDKLFPFWDINSFYTNASAYPLLGIELEKKDTAMNVTDRSLERVSGLKDLIILVDSDEYLGQPIAITLHYAWKNNVTLLWQYSSLNGNLVADADTTIVKYYNPTANYSLIETMLTDPVMYDAELLLNIIDIYTFDHFKAVKIDELEGLFYVNRISDFLATSPGTPTKVELIKIDQPESVRSFINNLSPVIIRNTEGDNINISSGTTLIEITAKVGNVLTLNTLSKNLISSTDIDWFAQSLDPSDYNVAEPSYTGDYLVQDKITDFDFVNKKITLVNATDFDVGEKICIYSPWANYEFIGDQTSSGIITKLGLGWRSKYVTSGPSWFDEDNNRYVVLVNGRNNGTNKYTVGFAYSSDLENWTIGNSDAPIILNSDHTNFANHVIAEGNVVDLGNGRVAFAVAGFTSTYQYCHIIEMDKNCTNISISNAVISGHKYYSSGLTKYNNKYVICTCNADNANLHEWTAEMWHSDSLTTGYSKVCDIFTTEYSSNDSIWIEGHADVFCPFVEDGKLYCWISGTQRYTISAIRGNRTMGLIGYDDDTNSWAPVNNFAPEIIFPMYFYNIPSEDYGWAGGHAGGYISFIKKDGECYVFCSFTQYANNYQISALKLF